MPTFLETAGVEREDIALDGLPLQFPMERDILYGQFQTGSVGLYQVLSRDWKYVYSAADRREYLIDRRYDPAETRNAAYNIYRRDTLLKGRELAKGHFGELAEVDFDATTHNTPLSLGGPSGRDAFRSLSIDEDAGGLILPDFWSSTEGDLFEKYREEYRRQEEERGKE
jgi:hypothetical protein